jgi:hypothetical protein
MAAPLPLSAEQLFAGVPNCIYLPFSSPCVYYTKPKPFFSEKFAPVPFACQICLLTIENNK